MEKKQRKRNSSAVTMMFKDGEVVGSAAWFAQFDERDFEASQILLQLHAGEKREKIRIPFTVVWGRKKLLASKTRRAAAAAAGGLGGGTTSLKGSEMAAPVSQRVVKAPAAAQATSPDTPLDINRQTSESEDYSSVPNQQPAKRKRKELMQDLQELNDCRENLRKEVEDATSYYKKLLADNHMWKQTKQMVEKSNVEMKNCSKFGVRSGQHYLETQHHHHQRQFFLNNPNPNSTERIEPQQFLVHPNLTPTARIEPPPQEKFQLHYHHHQQGPQLYGQGPSMLPMGRLSSKIGPMPKLRIVQPRAMEQERARMRAEKARIRRRMLMQEKQQQRLQACSSSLRRSKEKW